VVVVAEENEVVLVGVLVVLIQMCDLPFDALIASC
jgi:hypothetical protein